MEKKSSILTTLTHFTSQMFIKTQPHPILIILMFSLQFISLVIFSGLFILSNGQKSIKLSISSLQILSGIILSYQMMVLGIFIWLLVKIFKNGKNRQQNLIQLNFIQSIMEKILFYSLQIFRYVLSLPIIYLCFEISKYQNSQDFNLLSILSILNILPLLILIYPLSGLVFFNKIGITKCSFSYCYTLNIESLEFIFLPFYLVFTQYSSILSCYLGVLYFIFSWGLIYIHPGLTYKYNKIHQIGCSMMVGIIGNIQISRISGIQIDSFVKWIILIMSVLGVCYSLVLMQQKRMRRLLEFEGQKQRDCLDNYGLDENLLYLLINYKQRKQELILYLLSLINNQSNKKYKQYQAIDNNFKIQNIQLSQVNKQQKASKIKYLNNEISYDLQKKLIQIGYNIVQKLKQVNNNEQQIYQLLQPDCYSR